MTPQEASEMLRGWDSPLSQKIADLIDSLVAASELGPEVTLEKLKPSANYFVVRDDDVVVVGETNDESVLRWPDPRMKCGRGISKPSQDLKRIRSIHEIPAAWFPAAPPVKTEQEKRLDKINAAIKAWYRSSESYEVLEARIAAILEGAK